MKNLLKKLPFWRNYTTSHWSKWWEKRQIDWNQAYLQTWNHPHRDAISYVLASFPWMSLLEIGCGPGPNLVKIISKFKGKQVGGIDVNPEAIKLAQETFQGGFFKVNSAEDIMMSDNSADVILSDMCLIYFGPKKIRKALSEIKRIGRSHVVLYEFHSTSIYDRIKLLLTSGNYAYDYKRLLEKHGFYDIQAFKMSKEAWPDSEKHNNFDHIIIARIPKRK